MTLLLLTWFMRLFFIGLFVLLVVIVLASLKTERDTYEKAKEYSRKTGKW